MNTIDNKQICFKSFFEMHTENLSPADRDRCTQVCKTWAGFLKANIAYQNIPHLIQEGMFGATIIKDGKPLYLRLERITPENSAAWTQYKSQTFRVANTNRGLLPSLIILMKNHNLPPYDPETHATWGYSKTEFESFITVIESKFQTINLDAIKNNSVGSNHMSTSFYPEETNYICYITTNRDFNITSTIDGEFTYKNYIDNFKDILICVGTNFTDATSYTNRGIFRNPHWVLQQRYSGLSMWLHAFIGAVAEKYFPQKESMRVRPVGSMLAIIKNSLQPGDGHVTAALYDSSPVTDITELKVCASDPEIYSVSIKTSALTRIYYHKQRN